MDKKFTFNEDPELYERMRPKYPKKLINDRIEKIPLSKDKEILEIGSGAGQITCPLAEKGFTITCIELGKELAEFLVNGIIFLALFKNATDSSSHPQKTKTPLTNKRPLNKLKKILFYPFLFSLYTLNSSSHIITGQVLHLFRSQLFQLHIHTGQF